jgi:hypothetical protein
VYGNNGAGIYVSDSAGVEVFGNTVIAGTGNSGLNAAIIMQDYNRGSDGNGNLIQATGLNVHNNTMIHTTNDTSRDGLWIYQALYPAAATWDYNVYITPNGTGTWWEFDPLNGSAGGSTAQTWAQVQAGATYDQHSQNIVDPQAALSYPLTILSGAANGVGTVTKSSLIANPPGPYFPLFVH